MSLVTPIRWPAARRACALLASVAALGAFAAPASAAMFHLHLLRAYPADSATLTTPPAEIRLWFSERPEIAVTAIALSTMDGAPVALDKPTMANGTDTAAVIARVKGEMKPGRYVVRWRAASADMHPMRGQYTFTLTP